MALLVIPYWTQRKLILGTYNKVQLYFLACVKHKLLRQMNISGRKCPFLFSCIGLKKTTNPIKIITNLPQTIQIILVTYRTYFLYINQSIIIE